MQRNSKPSRMGWKGKMCNYFRNSNNSWNGTILGIIIINSWIIRCLREGDARHWQEDKEREHSQGPAGNPGQSPTPDPQSPTWDSQNPTPDRQNPNPDPQNPTLDPQNPPGSSELQPGNAGRGPMGLTLMMTQSAWPRAQGSHLACTSRLGFQWKSSRSSPALSTEPAWHSSTRHVLRW